jgi:hypothetical protein
MHIYVMHIFGMPVFAEKNESDFKIGKCGRADWYVYARVCGRGMNLTSKSTNVVERNKTPVLSQP